MSENASGTRRWSRRPPGSTWGDWGPDDDLGLLGADPLDQPGAPCLQGRPALGSVQQHARGLEQVSPQ